MEADDGTAVDVDAFDIAADRMIKTKRCRGPGALDVDTT